VQTGIIASFGVDSALVSVGGVVELRCRVTRIEGGNFVQLSKVIPGTTREELLTTNRVKEDSISGIARYSIEAERNGEHGYDFVLRITGCRFVIITLNFFIHSFIHIRLLVCMTHRNKLRYRLHC